MGREDDCYLSATDGRLRKLVVQATEGVRGGPPNNTWSRKPIGSSIPNHLRMVSWVLKRNIEGKESRWTWRICLRWLPACFGLLGPLCVPADLGGEVRNNGRYEQFKYHYWGHSYVPSNPRDAITPVLELNGIAERPLPPRYLCFLKSVGGMEVARVSDWEKHNDHGAILEYVFISYTPAQFLGREDWDKLHELAEEAARQAGVSAYWISCSCMPDSDQLSEDVSRYGDVIRGAHSLAIILGPPTTNRYASPTMSSMLQQWGERMWTFPDVLLSPEDRSISIYTRHGDFSTARLVLKRDFPREAWADTPVSSQLVNHYDGRHVLSPLELATLALQCLSTRVDNRTAFLPGDLTYVLTGLLRQRPKVNPQNTAFQEFYCLSLAIGNHRLLERLICLDPRDRNQAWHHIDDVWGCNLWGISPLCQVDRLGDDDTVIVSGAFTAPIRYQSFRTVNLLARKTVRRTVARFAVRGAPLSFLLAFVVLIGTGSLGGRMGFVSVIGSIIMVLATISILLSPFLLASLYIGKTWAAQPWLFGFEGYMDIAELETMIFGTNLNRLKWSAASTDLCRHAEQGGTCIGVDPTRDPAVSNLITRCRKSAYGEDKLFTLVDTNLMTVTLFTATRPPVALVLCGSEGSMQRGLLCSYDWKSQTLYKEAVTRVNPRALELMSRVDRFRLGLRRPLPQTRPAAS
ncbi:hypothetical protein BDW59DRAFT_165672 [Aspergillus cavernicola]|uniref:Uncharacterized protein n=1 Tax=Aspergillus cavernicola TaxID=176166 RepID=A0ABR4HR64_9EURO